MTTRLTKPPRATKKVKPKRFVMSANVAECIRDMWEVLLELPQERLMGLHFKHSMIINAAKTRRDDGDEE